MEVQVSVGIAHHLRLQLIAGHATFNLGVQPIWTLDRLDIVFSITHAGTYQLLGCVDLLRQFVRPVLWQAFFSRLDRDPDAVFRALGTAYKRTGIDLVADVQGSGRRDVAHIVPAINRSDRRRP